MNRILSILFRFLSIVSFFICGSLAASISTRNLPWWPSVIAGLVGIIFAILHLIIDESNP